MGDLRGELSLVWSAFFGRFGSKLNAIQKDAMPKILANNNVAICAPTASGKTEAVMAPIIQRLLKSNQKDGLRILYITPTRALAYDLRERLNPALTTLDLSLSVKTFERSEFDANRPTTLLITTPEGFDSLLGRHPQVLESLRAVVLDELHLLDNTYRGDQLRILLQRLVRLPCLRDALPRFYALSATMQDPVAVAGRYFSPVVVSQMPGQRELQWDLRPWPQRTSEVDLLYAELREQMEGTHKLKLLAFANSRDEVETLAQQLSRPPFERSVFAHHGKLSSSVRGDVEEAMRTRKAAICVATSTLEIGIDIGDIDLVLLFGPPPSVSSLLQRVGRGNRRSGLTKAIGFFRSPEEHDAFRWLFEQAQSGHLESNRYTPKLSVSIQQCFSYLFQRRKIRTFTQHISEVLRPLALTESEVELLLDHLAEHGWIRRDGSRVAQGDKLEQLIRRGDIHSNIPDQAGYRVLTPDHTELGWVLELAPIFFLHGRVWEVQNVDHVNRIAYVKRVQRSPSQPQQGVLSGRKLDDLGRFFPLLPEELRRRQD